MRRRLVRRGPLTGQGGAGWGRGLGIAGERLRPSCAAPQFPCLQREDCPLRRHKPSAERGSGMGGVLEPQASPASGALGDLIPGEGRGPGSGSGDLACVCPLAVARDSAGAPMPPFFARERYLFVVSFIHSSVHLFVQIFAYSENIHCVPP